jgi:hypothetical protein
MAASETFAANSWSPTTSTHHSIRACGICGAEDSWRHSLLECKIADEELLEHMCQTQEPEARNWLFTMLDTLTHDQQTRMSVTIWAIWHARSKAIHATTFQSPLSTHNFVERFISEPDQSKKPKPDKKERVPIPRHAAWFPTPWGCPNWMSMWGSHVKEEPGQWRLYLDQMQAFS